MGFAQAGVVAGEGKAVTGDRPRAGEKLRRARKHRSGGRGKRLLGSGEAKRSALPGPNNQMNQNNKNPKVRNKVKKINRPKLPKNPVYKVKKGTRFKKQVNLEKQGPRGQYVSNLGMVSNMLDEDVRCKTISLKYIRGLLSPKTMIKPAPITAQPTLTIYRSYNATFSPNAAGKAFITFSPKTALPNDQNTLSPLVIDNSANYTGTGGQGVGVNPIDLGFTFAIADVSSINLRSAIIRVQLEATDMANSGVVHSTNIYDAVAVRSTAATTVAPQNEYTRARVVSHPEYLKTMMRYNDVFWAWTPNDPVDNTPRQLNLAQVTSPQNSFVAIIEGMATTQYFTVIIEACYDIQPEVSGAYNGMGQVPNCSLDILIAAKETKIKFPGLFHQTVPLNKHPAAIAADFSTKAYQDIANGSNRFLQDYKK
jgi:hypothetical protein